MFKKFQHLNKFILSSLILLLLIFMHCAVFAQCIAPIGPNSPALSVQSIKRFQQLRKQQEELVLEKVRQSSAVRQVRKSLYESKECGNFSKQYGVNFNASNKISSYRVPVANSIKAYTTASSTIYKSTFSNIIKPLSEIQSIAGLSIGKYINSAYIKFGKAETTQSFELEYEYKNLCWEMRQYLKTLDSKLNSVNTLKKVSNWSLINETKSYIKHFDNFFQSSSSSSFSSRDFSKMINNLKSLGVDV